ncbi:MAG: alanine:cation symporter family protein [Candidatus Krumholzibacteriota bacterium]|nr:alanine:cation symporter family protein [Candidatus Krumholzibacteriota bacterium]
MDSIKNVVDTAVKYIWEFPEAMPYFIVLLLGVGIFLTIRMRFIQLRKVSHSLAVISGYYDDPRDSGEISHFQALTSALSATIGIGNISGVAIAIHYGGPGAMFWMWVTAILGTASKFVECTLSTHFRRIHDDGTVSGGPMYYIEKGMGRNWKFLAVIFAICAVISSFGSGNAVQAFTVADSFKSEFSIPTWITGLVLASLVGMVIIGGIKRIGKVTSRLVPIMSIIYFVGALTVLLLHASKLPGAFGAIFADAFTARAGAGGFVGSSFMFMLLWGVRRGIFSNEAGQGSAPIAHAAARTDEPVREGLVAMVGPYIDTLLICTLTGLVIITVGVWKDKKFESVLFDKQAEIHLVEASGVVGENGKITGEIEKAGIFPVTKGETPDINFVRNHSLVDSAVLLHGDDPFTGSIIVADDGSTAFADRYGDPVPAADIRLQGLFLQNGSPLTAWAFGTGLSPLGSWGNYIVTIAVFLFALSTAISWSYYGDRSIEYLLGPSAIMPYRFVFCVMQFVGAVFSLEIVWGFGDAALGLMAIPNLIAIAALSGVVKKLTDDYFSRKHKRYRTSLFKRN